MTTLGASGKFEALGKADASGVTSAIPAVDVDPFSNEFFENPHPSHEVMREAGPVVRFDKWNVYGVARYAEVHAVLNDPATFCSSRGRWTKRFRKGKTVAAAE